MRPGPSGTCGIAGDTISALVSSSLKTRSLDAMADCRMLYFSLRSWIGTEEALRVLHERDQHAEADRIADHLVSAEPDRPAIAVADSTSTTG